MVFPVALWSSLQNHQEKWPQKDGLDKVAPGSADSCRGGSEQNAAARFRGSEVPNESHAAVCLLQGNQKETTLLFLLLLFFWGGASN